MSDHNTQEAPDVPSITPLLFEGENLIRIVMRGSDPWFVAADVCRVLGHTNPSKAVENLDPDEKGITSTYTLGGFQDLLTISESGLYTLILRSRQATTPGTVQHRFRKWVTSEVLPSIRRTGAYAGGMPNAAPQSDGLHPEFPNWSMDELRSKLRCLDGYRMTYGLRAAQWILPQLGFPVPPATIIEAGRQSDMFEPPLPGSPH